MTRNRIDIWLGRISHITQLGLFILAIAGLYYTVIPLYQKAVVDEELAKKQVQLKELSAKIEEMYISARVTAIGQVIFAAGTDCSGLLTRPQPMPAIESLVTGKPYKEIPLEERPPRFEDVVLGTSVRECFAKYASKHKAVSILNPEDLAILEARMIDLGTALDIERLKIVTTLKRGSDDEKYEKASALSEHIRAAVQTLKDIRWNKAQQDAPADQPRPAGSAGD